MNTFIRKIKKGIPSVNIQAMNHNMSHRLFLFFLGGVIIGTFLLNIFMGNYSTSLGVYSEYFVNGINVYSDAVDISAFFIYCVKKYAGEFLMVLFMNLTPVGNLFNQLYCMYKGIVVAMLVSSATLNYGAGGLFLYIISVFPHYLLYVPLFVIMMYISMQLAEIIKEKKIGKFRIRAIIIIAGLIVGTSFLEAYANYPLLRIIFI